MKAGVDDPAPDPVGLFQTTPDRLQITKGQDQIAVFSFGEKNLLRWYASCCGTPLFNTPRNPKISFVGIRTNLFDDAGAIGPVRATGFIPKPNGKSTHEGLAVMLGSAIKRVAIQRVTGKWRQNLLFNAETARPISPVDIVSTEERHALLGRH